MHVETERHKVLYSKHFVTSQKCPFHLTWTLTLNTLYLTTMCNFGSVLAICLWSDFRKITKVSVTRDLQPWPWARLGCGLFREPLCASFPAIQPFNTVFEILSFKDIGVTTLTFRVMWHHPSRDQWIPKMWFPSQYESTMYLSRLSRYWASKISGSGPWPFEVTWRRLLHDH